MFIDGWLNGMESGSKMPYACTGSIPCSSLQQQGSQSHVTYFQRVPILLKMIFERNCSGPKKGLLQIYFVQNRALNLFFYIFLKMIFKSKLISEI